MPFERILKSVRRWLQHVAGHGKPYYLITKFADGNPLYLEAEMDVSGDYMMAERWVRNPARATVFDERMKTSIIRFNKLPEGGYWLPFVELPLYKGDIRQDNKRWPADKQINKDYDVW
jgi:hypothetical protein